MITMLFRRLSFLLFLFQVPCFAALQPTPSPSNKFEYLECSCKENCIKGKKDLNQKMLAFGYIREFESKEKKIIPDDLKSLCLTFFERFIPGTCIVLGFFQIIENYRPSKLDILDDYLAKYTLENVEDKSGNTLFFFAQKNSHLDILELLYKRRANINIKNGEGNKALHYVCEKGCLEIATWLIDECGVDIEAKNDYNQTPLLSAASNFHMDIVKSLYKKGANINTKDEGLNNVLHYACQTENIDCVQLLVENRVNINTKNKEGKTAIALAKEKNHTEIVAFLKKTQKKIDAGFREAAKEGNFEVLKDLYTQGANVDKEAIDLAKTAGHKEIVKFLEIIQKKINVALLIAAKKGHLEVLKQLKKIGVDPRYINKAIALAKENNYEKIVAFLETFQKG